MLYTHQNSDMFIQTIMSPAFLNASEYHGTSAKDFLLMKTKLGVLPMIVVVKIIFRSTTTKKVMLY